MGEQCIVSIFFTKWIAICDNVLYNNNANLCVFTDTHRRKENCMRSWQEIAALAALVLLVLVCTVPGAVKRARDRKWRAAERKLETVLQPRETIKAICPQKSGRVILTSKRLLFETREGFRAVALKDIKKVQGITKDKKTTTSVPKMVSLTVKAEKDHLIYNTSQEFVPLAKALRDRARRNGNKKKK